MNIHALFSVGAVREVLAVLLGVEVGTGIVRLSAVGVVLALDLLFIGCLCISCASTLLPM